MDFEEKKQQLTFEQQISNSAYDIMITASIYHFEPILFAQKIFHFIKDKESAQSKKESDEHGI